MKLFSIRATLLSTRHWRITKFWLDKLVERPEIMTQGRTLKELEENIHAAHRMMVPNGAPSRCASRLFALLLPGA